MAKILTITPILTDAQGNSTELPSMRYRFTERELGLSEEERFTISRMDYSSTMYFNSLGRNANTNLQFRTAVIDDMTDRVVPDVVVD
jgi:hypothetical protein